MASLFNKREKNALVSTMKELQLILDQDLKDEKYFDAQLAWIEFKKLRKIWDIFILWLLG